MKAFQAFIWMWIQTNLLFISSLINLWLSEPIKSIANGQKKKREKKIQYYHDLNLPKINSSLRPIQLDSVCGWNISFIHVSNFFFSRLSIVMVIQAMQRLFIKSKNIDHMFIAKKTQTHSRVMYYIERLKFNIWLLCVCVAQCNTLSLASTADGGLFIIPLAFTQRD